MVVFLHHTMLKLSLQPPTEYTMLNFATSQGESPAVPWTLEPYKSAGFTEHPDDRLDYYSGCAPINNRMNFRILKAARAYDERLRFLKEEGMLDGLSLNPESISGFLEFIEKYMPTVNGGLVLVDNGNLRAVWHSDCESFVGIQFINSRLAEYVLFSQTSPLLPVSRSYGQASINSVMNQIEALGLNWMLYE